VKYLVGQIGPGALRAVWFGVGAIALVLGVFGAVLPVLPTTPFVILAAFAFGKSSPQLQALLENSRLFGPVIADWRENGAIATRYKVIAIAMMVCVFGVSFVLSVPLWVLIVQAVCLTGAGMFILSRPGAAA
jgi:uncharacterized protein